MSDIFLARQPIFDQQMSVVGYELLYRHGNVEHALVDDDEVASARVAVNALTEIGLQNLVGQQRAWINVTREFLLQGLAYSLPPGRVVLELLEGQLVDEPLLEVLADVRAAGYQLALDDFCYEPRSTSCSDSRTSSSSTWSRSARSGSCTTPRCSGRSG